MSWAVATRAHVSTVKFTSGSRPRSSRPRILRSLVSYLPQPGTAKIKMFSHDFGGFHLKKQNVEVKKGIGLCCPDFYSF